MAMEAALSMLDGREFKILLAVIFSMGIFTGFVLSQAFCKSRGVNVTINGKDRRSHGDEKVNAKLSVSRGVETTLGPVEVLIPPTFWKNWLEICRTGTVVHCSPLCHYTRGKGLSRLQLCKAREKIITKVYWKAERTEAMPVGHPKSQRIEYFRSSYFRL